MIKNIEELYKFLENAQFDISKLNTKDISFIETEDANKYSEYKVMGEVSRMARVILTIQDKDTFSKTLKALAECSTTDAEKTLAVLLGVYGHEVLCQMRSLNSEILLNLRLLLGVVNPSPNRKAPLFAL